MELCLALREWSAVVDALGQGIQTSATISQLGYDALKQISTRDTGVSMSTMVTAKQFGSTYCLIAADPAVSENIEDHPAPGSEASESVPHRTQRTFGRE